MTPRQIEALELVTRVLNDNGVEFQISGGLAAITYGGNRPLFDIDLEIYKNDAELVRSLFTEYVVEDWNNELEGPEDQFDVWTLKLVIDGVAVDINQIEGSRVRPLGGEWVMLPEKMNVELRDAMGVLVPVQDKAELIAYKRLVGRDTDLADIRQLTGE